MTSFVRPAEPSPIMEINTTPLIDVMLVLLVMMIITIPLQSHAVKMDLPGPTPISAPLALKNRLAIGASGELYWNAQAVNRGELRSLLAASAQMMPEPELQLQPDPLAPYAAVDDVLAMTKRAQLSRVGFVGNEAYRNF